MRASQEGGTGFRRTGCAVGASSSSGYGYGNSNQYIVGTSGSTDYKHADKNHTYMSRSTSGWGSKPHKEEKKKNDSGWINHDHNHHCHVDDDRKPPDDGKGGLKGVGEQFVKLGTW